MADEDLNFKELQANISAALVETTRTVGEIAREDLAFHRSSDPSLGSTLDKQASRLLNLAQGLLKIATLGTELPSPQLQDADSVEENWGGIVDVIDNLLEKTDACLDEYTGVIRKSNPFGDSQSAGGSKKQVPRKKQNRQEVEKPQNGFLKVPRNNETTPFKPLLRSKPHAILPLTQSLTPIVAEDGSERYPNPYEYEITDFKYPDVVYTKADPIPFPPFASTQAVFVDTPEAVKAMLQDLRQAREIAIDLEHHDVHSYVGLVCLMQISTREKDWIVDTLKPWREDLQILNEVFTDPKVVKVLHGAFMDMIWLQRDLGLYVVGLFDTFHASRCLGYPRNSLAALLKKFVNFDANKQYQLADWRIRPLPDQMYAYARSDTHFLLFIYDHLRNELVDQSDFSLGEGDLITQVLERSKQEALQRYERYVYDAEKGQGPGGWYNMLSRTPNLFNREQFSVFRAVHQWRDQIARTEDEGSAQVMPKHVLYSIARSIPMDMPSLLACSHPISPTLRVRTRELLEVVQQAKLAGAHGPEMKDVIEPFSMEMQIDSKPTRAVPSAPIPRGAITVGHILESPITMRSGISRFWGGTLDGASALHDETNSQMQLKALRLVLPLPPLTAEVFEPPGCTGRSARESETADPGARAEHQYTRERKPKDTGVFVVKQLGGSRKRTATEMENPPGPDVPPPMDDGAVLDGSDDDAEGSHVSSVMAGRDNHTNGAGAETGADTGTPGAPTKLSRSQRKRARLRAEAQRNNEAARKEEDPDAKPFDYGAAPSILHPKKTKSDRAGVKTPLDPYAKSLDAPKAMRKSQKDFGGKSFTFAH